MFRIKGKEVLVEGVKKGNFTISQQSDGDSSGTFIPLEVIGKAAVGGKGGVKSPLSFTMVGCKNKTGAIGTGAGTVTTKQVRATDGTKYLVVGDEGKCIGALVGSPPQKPGPCCCKFELSSSGEGGPGAPPMSNVIAEEETPDGRLEVRYLDPDGKPIPGAKCTVVGEDGSKLLGDKDLDSSGRTTVPAKHGQPKLVTVSIYADTKPLKVLPEYDSITNPLKSIVPASKKSPAPNEGRAVAAAGGAPDDGELEWLAPPKSLSLKDWIYGVAVGDFNEDASIDQTVARTVITLIPVVDQIGDLQDLAASFYHLVWEERYAEPLRWITLATTLVGCFPEAGSAAKGVLKILWRSVGERFPQLVRFLNLVARGNAVKWLWKLKDKLGAWSGKLTKLFTDILDAIRKKLVTWAGWVPGVKRLAGALQKVRALADAKIAEAIGQLAAKLEECLTKESKRFEVKVATGRKYTIKQAKQARKLPKAKARAKVPLNKDEYGVAWVPEGSRKPGLKEGPPWREYEGKVEGAFSDVASERKMSPVLEPPHPNPTARTKDYVRFDGRDANDPRILIDRKMGATLKPDQQAKFKKGTLEALKHNPNNRLRIEVPNKQAQAQVRNLINKTNGKPHPRIDVVIVPPP